MIVKCFELRDSMTFIPVMAVSTQASADPQHWLLRRAGYSVDSDCILLCRLNGGPCHYDPYEWGDRTFMVAHNYIRDNWASLKDSDVVDVQFILGETTTPTDSERTEHYP